MPSKRTARLLRRAVVAKIANVRSAVVLMGCAPIAIAPHAAVPVADVAKTVEAHAARHRKRRFREKVAARKTQTPRMPRVPMGKQPAASPEALHFSFDGSFGPRSTPCVSVGAFLWNTSIF